MFTCDIVRKRLNIANEKGARSKFYKFHMLLSSQEMPIHVICNKPRCCHASESWHPGGYLDKFEKNLDVSRSTKTFKN